MRRFYGETDMGIVTIGGSEYISYGILSAVSVLVIACPCASGVM